MESSFFAILIRMKYIARWGLMRNTRSENLAEHTLDTAFFAHALAVLCNKRFGGNIDTGRTVQLAMFHDAAEIFTGDLPTPVKYFSSEMRGAYKEVEKRSVNKLLRKLPRDLRSEYADLLMPDEEDTHMCGIVKAADKLSALVKCIEESKAGNVEFKKAEAAQESYLKQMGLPEVDCFMREFLPAFRLTLDEQDGKN